MSSIINPIYTTSMQRNLILSFCLSMAPLLGWGQNFDWVTHVPGLSEEIAQDIVIGPSGNAYVCGAFGNTMILPSGTITSEGFRDGFLFKFDPQGNLLWHTLMTSSFGESPIEVEVDSLERIYVLIETGDTLHIQGQTFTNFSEPYLVLQFDSAGQYLNHFEPIADNGQGAGFAFAGMSVSPGGRISIAGSFGAFTSNSQSITIGTQTLDLPVQPSSGFRIPQGFTAQYQQDGTVLWADLTNGSGTSDIYHVGAAPDGGVVVCGRFSAAGIGINPDFDFGPGTPSLSTDFGDAGFLARYDSSGNVVWAQAMQPGQPVVSQFTQANAQKLAVDPSGAVYIYGEYIENVRWGADSVNAFPPPFFGTVLPYGYVAKASPAGTPLWIQGVSFADGGNARVNVMTADSANVFLGGNYTDTLLIGGLGLFGGLSDIWFTSLDGSNGQGNYLQAVNAPGFPDEVNGLALREDGRLFVTGVFDPPATFGPFSITQPANSCCSNFFIAGYGVGCTGPTAAFTADSSGVYSMNFLNQSTTNGPVTYQWDFGDGNGSVATNPAHAYAAPGTYTVCLIADDSCGVDTFCQQVEVPCQPGDLAISDFTFVSDTTNLTVFFTDLSVNADDYFWTYGDGNTSTLPSAFHQYNLPGTYEICLTVSNACNADTFCQMVVAQCDTSEIGFTFDSDTTNLTVTFTDQSVNVGDYLWSFGDGNTSTLPSPVHQYNQPGTYTVCLITQALCDIDTLCQQVVAQCDTSEIGFTFDSDTSNLTVTFTDQSVNVDDYLWFFGDGNTSTLPNPVHQYFLPGTYTVCLITQALCDIDTLCQQVVAQCDTSEIGFTFDSDTTNLTVTFTDQSVNVDTYSWFFGDGNVSTLPNPVHQYNQPGIYTVCLITSGLCDIDTLCQQVEAQCDSSEIGFTFSSDTTNATITFTDQSVNVNDYLWSFGDGITSTLASPVHQYIQPGIYTVCLITTGPCDIDTLCQQVEASCDSSEIGFAFSSDTTNLTITFTDQSVNVDDYLWSFGDGNSSNLPSPVHQYSQPGSYTVCLITRGPCDIDTLCQQVEAQCDTAEIGYTFDSDTTNLTVTFTDQSANVDDYLWSFGDGNSSNMASPVHQYNQPGTYTVCLITQSLCDIDTLCQEVVADCDTTAIGFVVDDISPTGEATIRNTTVNAESYLWSFGDGATSNEVSPVHQYDPGSYTLCLIALGPCDIDTLCEEVLVNATGISQPLPAWDDWRIYPNPFASAILVEPSFPLSQPHTLSLYDLRGTRLTQVVVPAGTEGPIQIPADEWPVGLYLIRAQGGDLSHSWWVQKR